MEIDSLKSNWKNTGSGLKDQKELLMMRKIKNHSNIKRIRLKFIIESVLVLFFLAIAYEAFDAGNKALWANLIFLGGIIFYLIVRLAGLLLLRNPINGNNLQSSLMSFKIKLQRMAFAVLLSSLLFGLSIILFFSSSVDFSSEKIYLLTGMLLTLFLFVFLSSRIWFKRVETINVTLKELKPD
ncbi:MAG: hypothetical protein RH860_00970 [Cytophagales bacterium]